MAQAVENEVFDAGVLESSIPRFFYVDSAEGCLGGENTGFGGIANLFEFFELDDH